jgi:hypothetical protein
MCISLGVGSVPSGRTRLITKVHMTGLVKLGCENDWTAASEGATTIGSPAKRGELARRSNVQARGGSL